MGAWAEGAFDNDTAADWSAEFANADAARGLQIIRGAWDDVGQIDTDAYIDGDAGQTAVAAAELVAAMRQIPVERTPYNEAALDSIARTNPAADAALTSAAIRGLERVVGPNSELAELWDEAGSATWGASITHRVTSLG